MYVLSCIYHISWGHLGGISLRRWLACRFCKYLFVSRMVDNPQGWCWLFMYTLWLHSYPVRRFVQHFSCSGILGPLGAFRGPFGVVLGCLGCILGPLGSLLGPLGLLLEKIHFGDAFLVILGSIWDPNWDPIRSKNIMNNR